MQTPTADPGLDAVALLERHFDALNRADRAAFRETVVLFDAIDGRPFEAWWRGMRALAPLSVSLSVARVGRRVSNAVEPHTATWVRVEATSEATGQRFDDELVVWHLLGSRQWKLGCRVHWWLQPSAARDDRGDDPSANQDTNP